MPLLVSHARANSTTHFLQHIYASSTPRLGACARSTSPTMKEPLPSSLSLKKLPRLHQACTRTPALAPPTAQQFTLAHHPSVDAVGVHIREVGAVRLGWLCNGACSLGFPPCVGKMQEACPMCATAAPWESRGGRVYKESTRIEEKTSDREWEHMKRRGGVGGGDW